MGQQARDSGHHVVYVHQLYAAFGQQLELPANALLGKEGRPVALVITSYSIHYTKLYELAHHQPAPSLLHGNLWRGNLGFCDGEGVLYDPACYYGDREVDIAMSELFGSLPSAFYQGYNEVWPLDDTYQIRKEIYNLYPLLNQLYQFGEGYHHQVTLKLQHVLAL